MMVSSEQVLASTIRTTRNETIYYYDPETILYPTKGLRLKRKSTVSEVEIKRWCLPIEGSFLPRMHKVMSASVFVSIRVALVAGGSSKLSPSFENAPEFAIHKLAANLMTNYATKNQHFQSHNYEGTQYL